MEGGWLKYWKIRMTSFMHGSFHDTNFIPCSSARLKKFTMVQKFGMIKYFWDVSTKFFMRCKMTGNEKKLKKNTLKNFEHI